MSLLKSTGLPPERVPTAYRVFKTSETMVKVDDVEFERLTKAVASGKVSLNTFRMWMDEVVIRRRMIKGGTQELFWPKVSLISVFGIKVFLGTNLCASSFLISISKPFCRPPGWFLVYV